MQSFTCCVDKCCLSMQTSFVTGEQRRVSIWFLRDLTPDQTIKPLPNKHTHTHTLLFCAALSRQEECYRLTQRKSACRPVLTQGPSLLWSGQCPTVSLEAVGTQHRKQPSSSTILLSSFFCTRISIFPFFCDLSSLACLSSAVTVHT